MDKKIEISEKTKAIILRRLHLSLLNEVLFIPFASSKTDIDRSRAKKYNKRITGSIRYRNSRYYTNKEFRNRINRINKLELP